MEFELSDEEKKYIESLLKDPKKTYQLLMYLHEQLSQLEAAYQFELKKEASTNQDQKKISFLQKIISNFHS